VRVAAEPTPFPLPLSAYPTTEGGILAILAERIRLEPLNAIATGIFLLAILHTFAAPTIAARAQRRQRRDDERRRAAGLPPQPSVAAGLLTFCGEVEIVFGLWAVPVLAAISVAKGWAVGSHYVNDEIAYTEALFVVVIMSLASSRPIITFAEGAMRRVAELGRGTPAAWWFTILTVGPILGSLITEPAAMTISALLLGRQFYDLSPSNRLKYATLGLLFVNVSIGGTLTHFAAPPVLMVARHWNWDTPFMLEHFGWRTLLAIVASNAIYFFGFRKELRALSDRAPVADVETPESVDATSPAMLPVPAWLIVAHLLFLAWTVFNSHYSVLFVGGFLFFLGFVRATTKYQSQIDLKSPLLVGFFLAGLVIHGGLQAWWIGPVLSHLSEQPLFFGAAFLTAFNDNALITYLSTLVPNLSDGLKAAVVEGAVAGGGLTVIANAPNPAGQSLLARFFDSGVSPLYLAASALLPTAVTVIAYRYI